MDRQRRTRRTRRKARRIDDVVQEDGNEEEQEEVVQEPKRRSRRTRAVESEPEPAEETVEEEQEEEETPRKRLPHVRVRVKPDKNDEQPEPGEEPAGPEEVSETVRSKLPQTLNMALEGQLVLDMLEAMREGETYVIGRVDKDQWRIAISKEAVVVRSPKQLKGIAYQKEVYTEEFFEHEREWGRLSTEEKWQRIEESGVEWDEVDNDRVNMMRATGAYREHLGIEKYKPMYRKRSTRAAVRGE